MEWKIRVNGAHAKLTKGHKKLVGRTLRIQNPPVFTKKCRPLRPGESAWNRPVVTYTRFFSHTTRKFPAGFVEKVCAAAEKHGDTVSVINAVPPLPAKLDPNGLYEQTARPYQVECAETLLAHRDGVAEVGTGGGKTLIEALLLRHLVVEHDMRCLLLVPTKDLLHDTSKSIRAYVGPEISVGLIGDGRRQTDAQIVVALPNTLRKGVPPDSPSKASPPPDPRLREFIKRVDVLIIDECHGAGSPTWYDIAMSCPANRRYGFSGTPKTGEALRDAKLLGVCGPIRYIKKSQDLIEEGYLSNVALFFCLDPQLYDPIHDDTDYRYVYHEGIVANQAYHRFVIKLTRKLVETGRQVMITCRRVAHARKLCRMLKQRAVAYLSITGSTPTPRRGKIKNAFRKRKVNVLVATKVLDVGVDLPAADALILAGGEKAKIGLKQRIGRVLRTAKGKANALVFDFSHDSHRYLLDHAMERLRTYRKEGIRVEAVKSRKRLLERISAKKTTKIAS